jgi:hypothetical protein
MTGYGPPSERTHERKWRVARDGDPPAFRVRDEDVAFLVIGANIDAGSVPTVFVDPLTGGITDHANVWYRAFPQPPRRSRRREVGRPSIRPGSNTDFL